MATIRKRGEAWNAQVRRKGFPAVSATFDTKAQAEAWVRKVEHEQDLGVSPKTVDRVTTLSDLFLRYAREGSAKKKGRRWEEVRLEAWAASRLARLTVSELNANHLKGWRDGRLKTVSAATFNREFNLMSAVFTHAIREWGIPWATNPCKWVTRPPSPKNRTQRWSDADLEKVATHCRYVEGKAPTSLTEMVPHILYLAVETAMRRGEIFSIMIEDIHPAERYVRLRDSKNGDAAAVPLSDKALKMLETLSGGRTSGRLIPHVSGSFDTYFRRIRKAIGLSHLHFHDARREAATRMSKKLSNVLELSAVTRHKSLKCLQVYYAPTPAEIAEKLS